MNGAAFRNGPTQNGDVGANQTAANITHALEIIHSSRSANDTRQKASEFLESQKGSREAPKNGYKLAADRVQPAVVRHFGLSLLEHAVRHNWPLFTDVQILEIRNWTISLTQNKTDDDPLYLRNKIAQLLVELAKKDWVVSWFDMDSLLLVLWKQGLRYKEFVLTALECLSEDVFVREDSAAALRGQDFNNAVVEIFTPTSAFVGGQNKGNHHLRADDDGWLARISQFLETASQTGTNDKEVQACICKALATFRSVFSWVMGSAIISAHCLESIFACLALGNPEVLVVRIFLDLPPYRHAKKSPGIN
jgi:exportin-5